MSRSKALWLRPGQITTGGYRLLGAALLFTLLATACSSDGSSRAPSGATTCAASCSPAGSQAAAPANSNSASHTLASNQPRLSGQITARRCPTVEDIGQLVGKPIRQINDTQLTTINGQPELYLVCQYTPITTPAPGAGSYGVNFTMHGPDDTGAFTSLAAALADEEKSSGLSVGSTKTFPQLKEHLFYTPDLGPGTYASYTVMTVTGQLLGGCGVYVLGPNGYVMNVDASAQAPTGSDGDVSEAILCRWAEGAARLAMTA